mmetsp:Transcript_27328/g.70309  ORF Transcript_27328/g.70309 Transcript_27328/m.70309 type:complete len:87 (+) Transcript_27328:598-858(+)
MKVSKRKWKRPLLCCRWRCEEASVFMPIHSYSHCLPSLHLYLYCIFHRFSLCLACMFTSCIPFFLRFSSEMCDGTRVIAGKMFHFY